jgi:hypothetical protein
MTKARDLANGGFGLVLVKPSSVVGGTDNGKGTISITSGTSVSLNGVFTSTYSNYRIECSNLLGSNFMNFRFRVSGSDDSSSNYRFRSYRGSTMGPGSDDTSQYSSNTTLFQTIYLLGGADTGSCSIEVYSPQLAAHKQVTVVGFDAPSNGYTVLSGGKFIDATKQFDGFTLTTSSGFSGQVSVYGYNK